MIWQITDKGDPDALRLVDGQWEDLGGRPHYSRVTPGARSFTRNGQNIVLITDDGRAVWVTFRPTPGKATRMDGLDAWECALFRNEGPHLSSLLIAEAVELSCALWGTPPRDGVITYVRPDAVRSGRLKCHGKPFSRPPGYCYLKAGWQVVGASSDGKPMLRAPLPSRVAHWTKWSWRGDRGGVMRLRLENNLRMVRFARTGIVVVT